MLFSPITIGTLKLKNRIVRSATFEGMADKDGNPTEEYIKYYQNLLNQNIGLVITGFMYVNIEGKAIQPGQASLCSESVIPLYKKITKQKGDTKIFAQISHCGRQTNRKVTGGHLWAPSKKRSLYFGEVPDMLSEEKINSIIRDYSESAYFAKLAGFDGIQLHAAHGYLIHQFILSSVNKRSDIYGIDSKTGIGTLFFEKVIEGVRNKCGEEFLISVKISGADDYGNTFDQPKLRELVRFLDTKNICLIEISYGTMDYPLNIIRGSDIPIDSILKYNIKYKTDSIIKKFFFKKCLLPILKIKIKKNYKAYNEQYAQIAKDETSVPIILVGGLRSREEMEKQLRNKNCDMISMCRTFICENDLAVKLLNEKNYSSCCISCNLCLIMCDTDKPTKCYQKVCNGS
ncbi:MAG TPA: NADH:flavin oxidoreductase [Spirochaetota bacterium]|nr:NADH:flavin oxidoreductase [Spirochaetota bacterium]